MKPSNQFIDQLLLQKQRNRQIRQLAGALMQSFQIPEGHDLVLHLSGVHCRNNREALTHWVRQQMVDTSSADASESLRTLTLMLHRKFQSIDEGCDGMDLRL